MRPAVREVVEHGGWKIEIVGFKHSMSNELVNKPHLSATLLTRSARANGRESCIQAHLILKGEVSVRLAPSSLLIRIRLF